MAGIAVIAGRPERVREPFRDVVFPGAKQFGQSARLAYVVVALGFIIASQLVWLAHLRANPNDLVGLTLAVVQFLAVLVPAMRLASPKGKS
jgi:hypothetical protein